LLQAKALNEVIDLLLILAFHVFGRITGDGGVGTVVEAHTMSSNQKAGIEIELDDALDASLIEVNVLARRYRHERVRSEGLLVYARFQFPFLPAIVMFGDREAKGRGGLGTFKELVTILASKESSKKRMVGLADSHHGIAFRPQNHELPLVRQKKFVRDIIAFLDS